MSPIQRHSLAVLVLVGVVILAYAGSVGNGFIWDDNFQIVSNPYVHSNQPLSKLFFSDVWGYMQGGEAGLSNYYRPLQILSYRWTAEIAGLKPAAFHLVSLILNALACIAAYGVFWQWTKHFRLALSAAVIFSVHPMHSEAVLWIASLPELGCALFYFLAFSFFLCLQQDSTTQVLPRKKARQMTARRATQMRSRGVWLATSCICLLVALFWKEMALTFPAVVFAYCWFNVADNVERRAGAAPTPKWNQRLWRSVRSSLPFWGVVGIYAAIRVAVLGYFSRVQNPWPLSPFQSALNVATLAGEYCLRLAVPTKLNAYHVFHPVRSMLDPRVIGAAILLISMAALIFVGSRRAPVPAFALSWILLTLAPVLSLQSVGLNVFAERYLYIPSLGFALLLAWAGAQSLKKFEPATRRYGAIIILALLSTAAIAEIRQRVPDWRDEHTFYARTVATSPDAAQMRIFLGTVLRNDGDIDGAQHQYEEALRDALSQQTKAQVASAYLGLAFVAWRHQHYDQALEFVDRGLTYANLHGLSVEKGILLLQVGRLDEAQQVLEGVSRSFPYDQAALNGLGLVHLAKHEPTKAIQYFSQSVEFNPLFAQGYYNLGKAYLEIGRTDEALPAFERATELQPSSSLYRSNYGSVLARIGRYDEAREQLQRVLETEPSNALASAVLNQINQNQPTRH